MIRIQLLATAISALVAFPALAAEPASGPLWGTPKALAKAPARAQADLGTVQPAKVYSQANYGTGSVALRNRLAGGLEVSTAPPPVKAAFLYWAVITNGPVPAADVKPTLKRLFPGAASVTLTGTAVGTGTSPCWGPVGSSITVFKAAVPRSVANGNGLYEVLFPKGASGDPSGSDPWVVAQTLPMLEGATLVVVGSGGATVALYDKGLSGQTFGLTAGDVLSYQLPLPGPYAGNQLRIDFVGADGQLGSSRTADPNTSGEVTTVNGSVIAGPGSVASNDSDWNGHIGDPIPQLWDDTSHDLRPFTSVGATSLSVAFTAPLDCLTPVVNVVGVR